MEESVLKPLLKYPGGKTSELSVIQKKLPKYIENYIEPFVGGGAVFFALNNSLHNYINDKSRELILLYRYVKDSNKTFFDELNIIVNNWENLETIPKGDLISVYSRYKKDIRLNLQQEVYEIVKANILDGPMFNIRKKSSFEDYLIKCITSKLRLMKKNETKNARALNNEEIADNIEAGIKASYYTYLRDVYNRPQEYNKLSEPRRVAIYFFIREYCYSSMFRFNSKGEFNVPYVGISYNKKSLKQKMKYFTDSKLKKLLKNTDIFDMDFEYFLSNIKLEKDDFMFLDPPYDTVFSEYDQNEFDNNDQVRLANYLINKCPCNFMLIIKKTDFIMSLYEGKGLNIEEEDKNYHVSFKNRNAKRVKHLIITNY